MDRITSKAVRNVPQDLFLGCQALDLMRRNAPVKWPAAQPTVRATDCSLALDRLSRHRSRSRSNGFQEPFRVRDPAQRHLGTQERGVVIASWQSMADRLAHAGQQDA